MGTVFSSRGASDANHVYLPLCKDCLCCWNYGFNLGVANSHPFNGNGSGQSPSGQASIDLLSASLHDNLAEEIHKRVVLLLTSSL